MAVIIVLHAFNDNYDHDYYAMIQLSYNHIIQFLFATVTERLFNCLFCCLVLKIMHMQLLHSIA